MLNPDDRLVIWQDFYERVNDLFRDAEDVLNNKFAPYREEPDKDTPEVKKLFDVLADLDTVLQQKVRSSSEECEDWYEEQRNAQDAFEAWSQGLCPSVMRTRPRYIEYYRPETVEQVARFRQHAGMSIEDTKQALAMFEAKRVADRLFGYY